jgi:hypothetical protein
MRNKMNQKRKKENKGKHNPKAKFVKGNEKLWK